MNPLISVALCTYNGEKFLEKQLLSILHQTKMIDELIVFDDLSSDSTIEILNNFQTKVPFNVSIHQNTINLGSCKNFENCMKACTGDVIFLCDQDDVWEPQKVEKQLEFLMEHPEKDAVFSNATMINQSGQPTGMTSFEQIQFVDQFQELWNNGGAFDILLRGYVVTGATLAIRSRILPEIFPVPRIIDELIHDGWISLWLSIQNRIGFLNDTLIQYREHASQQVGLKGKSKFVTLWDRFTRNREEKITKIRKKFIDSQSLLNYLSNRPEVPLFIIQKLQKRTSHYQMRSGLPNNRLKRIFPVLSAGMQGNYKLQDGGKWWHPILGDILE
ncbi:glycosyltransferase [Aquirufa sp. ROCK2-A2]